MAAIEGTGIAITFQSGLFGEILDLQGQGRERAAIPTSHFGTVGAKTYMPAKNHDPGQWVVQIHFDPSVSIDGVMEAAAETITVTFTDAGAATWATSGFAVSEGIAAPYEDRVVETYTLQLSGATTVTP